MSEFESMNHEQKEFEQSLKQLRPLEPGLNVAELMFRAGQDAARRESRRQLLRWQLSTLVTSVCALLAVVTLRPGPVTTTSPETSIVNRDDQHPTVREAPQDDVDKQTSPENKIQSFNTRPAVVQQQEPAIGPQPRPPLFEWWNRTSTVSVTTEDSYLELRNRVLRDGMDALPEPEPGGGSTSSQPLTSSPLQLRDALERELWNEI